MKTAFKTLAISISLIAILTSQISQAATRYSIKTGLWSVKAVWSTTSGGSPGASVPVSGDLVIIEGGYVVTVNTTVVCDSIVIQESGDFTELLITSGGDLTVDKGVLLKSDVGDAVSMLRILSGVLTITNDLVIKAYSTGGGNIISRTEGTGQLTVNGNIYLWSDGPTTTLHLRNDAIATVAGNIYMDAASSGGVEAFIRDESVLNIAGNFIRLNNQGDYYGDLDCLESSVVNYNGTSAQTFAMKVYDLGTVTETWTYGEVRINNTAGVTLDANISTADNANSVLDDIRIQSGTLYSGGYSIGLENAKIFEIASGATYYTTTTDTYGGMLDTTGAFANQTGSHSIDVNSTVNFAATGAQNVPDPSNSEAYGNLIASGGATKTLTGNIDVNGDLTIAASSTLDAAVASNYTINLAGNWTDNGTFNEQSGSVTLDGTGAQTVNGVAETFYNLIINKATNDVTLNNTSTTVTNNLQLTSADIVLGTNNLVMDNSSAVTGAPGSGSYVQAHSSGKMRKNFNTVTNFTYPIGDNDDYSPMTFTLNAGTTLGGSDFIELNVSDAKHTNVGGGDHITRYWGVNASGMSAINYDFGATYTTPDISGTETGLLSSSWNSVSSKWTSYASVNTGANQIRNTTAITVIPVNFDFTAAAGEALPIQILNFDAVVMDQSVSLTWETASEIDNDFFTIERTVNGVDFKDIATIDGAGQSFNQLDYTHMDRKPLAGISYYRLKQTDHDGEFTYSDVVGINFENTAPVILNVFPNPAIRGQDLQIRVENTKLDKEVSITLVDQFGRELFSKMIINTDKPVLQTVAPTDKLAPGLYFVISSSESGLLRQKLIITGSGGGQSSFVQKNGR